MDCNAVCEGGGGEEVTAYPTKYTEVVTALVYYPTTCFDLQGHPHENHLKPTNGTVSSFRIFHLMPILRTNETIPRLRLCAFLVCTGIA